MSNSSRGGFHDTTAAILAGGLGTRLRAAVADRPKALALIAGRPFLEYQLDQLAAAGVRHVVLCTGYMADQVCATLGSQYAGMRIDYSRETEPLGTGGALRLAFPWIDTPRVLVLNGDSYCGADLRQFAEFHHANRADLSMLLVQVANTERFGQVEVDDDSRVCAFREKGASHGTGWINAGIYLIERRLITAIPTGRPVSLEREMIPVWMQGKFFGQRAAGSFLDIGTPESYAAAAKFFAPRVAA